MLVTELGMVMLVRPLQYWNALSPMLVTELGMVMLVSLLQLENALYPMLVKKLEFFGALKYYCYLCRIITE